MRGAVALGVDTFDSCLPTRRAVVVVTTTWHRTTRPRTHSGTGLLLAARNARHGTLSTRAGTIHIGQGKYKRDFGPIDPTLETIGHSRAYLHHLYRVKERPLWRP